MREQRRAVGTSSAERPKLRASGADEWTRPEGTMANSPRFQPGVDFNREGKSQRDDVSHARHNRNKQASNEHVHQSHISHHIQQQEEHHKKQSFKDEFLAFLKRHNIDYDPKYVFETEHVG